MKKVTDPVLRDLQSSMAKPPKIRAHERAADSGRQHSRANLFEARGDKENKLSFRFVMRSHSRP